MDDPGQTSDLWVQSSKGRTEDLLDPPSSRNGGLRPLCVVCLQFQMTFHLFIAAFVGAAVTLVALVSLAKGPLDLSLGLKG